MPDLDAIFVDISTSVQAYVGQEPVSKNFIIWLRFYIVLKKYGGREHKGGGGS